MSILRSNTRIQNSLSLRNQFGWLGAFKINIRYKIKYKIIQVLDLLPQTCWVYLVLWAQDYDITLKQMFKQNCRLGREGYGYAYCGKCENNGRFLNEIEN